MSNAQLLRASIRLQVVLLFMVTGTFGQQRVVVANQFHGEYQNRAGYAYRVTLPLKLTGCTVPAPAPSHGFAVDLSIKDGAFIWVDGSWNAALYSSSSRKKRRPSSGRAAVRKSTKIGSHTELRNRVEGGSIAASYFLEVPNDWAVAYGRIVKAADLEQNCDFKIERGGYASAPLAIMATDLLNLKPP